MDEINLDFEILDDDLDHVYDDDYLDEHDDSASNQKNGETTGVAGHYWT